MSRETSAQWIDPKLMSEIFATGTTAFRIFSSRNSWIERFGHTALISAKSPSQIPHLFETLQGWSAEMGWVPQRIYSRVLVRNPNKQNSPTLLSGKMELSSRETVMENQLRYEVDFSTGYSPGLFCDQRENRKFLQKLKARRLLNTFAYTCAFSVAAAAAGAETVSVDISKSSLQRGRHNFELNALDLQGHRFIVEDVPTYLQRLARRGEKFDAIILDPPTFGRGGKGKEFQIEKDLEHLLTQTLCLALPGTAILLSTNYAPWAAEHLRSLAMPLIPASARFHSTPPPKDFSHFCPSATVWVLLAK